MHGEQLSVHVIFDYSSFRAVGRCYLIYLYPHNNSHASVSHTTPFSIKSPLHSLTITYDESLTVTKFIVFTLLLFDLYDLSKLFKKNSHYNINNLISRRSLARHRGPEVLLASPLRVASGDWLLHLLLQSPLQHIWLPCPTIRHIQHFILG